MASLLCFRPVCLVCGDFSLQQERCKWVSETNEGFPKAIHINNVTKFCLGSERSCEIG